MKGLFPFYGTLEVSEVNFLRLELMDTEAGKDEVATLFLRFLAVPVGEGTIAGFSSTKTGGAGAIPIACN